jgi:hypothetical protein
MNRLTQHFAALGIIRPSASPAVVVQPLEGESHYAIARYCPFDLSPGWLPATLEDSIRSIRFEAITFYGRHRALLPALVEARHFNSLMMRDDRPPMRWATVAWIDNGTEEVTQVFARVVTPLRYVVWDPIAPADWTPRTLLDPPCWSWTDEVRRPVLKFSASLDKAALRAAKSNSRFRKRKKDRYGIGARWSIVLAFEAEPVMSLLQLDFGAGRGVSSLHRCSRFHVVDPTWPLAAETLALVKGGASNG